MALQNRVTPLGEIVADPARGDFMGNRGILQTIPDYDYRYVYVNGQPVLVDPNNRQVVYVVR